jgi:DNA-directed RNA polymerase specialized sigma24 family protein
MMDDPPAGRADAGACAEDKWMLDGPTDAYFSDIHRYAAARLGHAAADDLAAGTFLAAFDQRGRDRLSR